MIVTGAGVNTLVQTIVDDAMRGRVMSFYTMSFLGMAPLGSVTIGAIAEAAGVQVALGVGGVACAAAGVEFMRGRSRVRAALRAAAAAADREANAVRAATAPHETSNATSARAPRCASPP